MLARAPKSSWRCRNSDEIICRIRSARACVASASAFGSAGKPRLILTSHPCIRPHLLDRGCAMSEVKSSALGVRRCGMCGREGTVGFHPEPHHGNSYLCVNRRACASRWRRGVMRRSNRGR